MKHKMPVDIQSLKRRLRSLAVALLAICAANFDFCPKTHAASISVATPDATITVPKGQLTTSVRLNLKNDEPAPVSLMVWFISLQVVADPTATGSLQFASVSQPSDYFLDGATPFGAQLVIGGPPPTTHASFSDAALLTQFGVEAAGNATVRLFDLNLSASPDAFGKFRIILFPFEGPQPSSSSWSIGSDPGTPRPFSNSTFGEQTLVAINFVPEPSLVAMATGFLAVPLILRSPRSRMSDLRLN